MFRVWFDINSSIRFQWIDGYKRQFDLVFARLRPWHKFERIYLHFMWFKQSGKSSGKLDRIKHIQLL